MITIGLLGDYTPTVIAHQAIPTAIRLAGEAQQIDVGLEWVPTDEIQQRRTDRALHGSVVRPRQNGLAQVLSVRGARNALIFHHGLGEALPIFPARNP
jgi:CTP synthase (UTP-ammonia lyase)